MHSAYSVDGMTMITTADTSEDRADVQAFFHSHFEEIAPNAVPAVEHDHLYAPVILTVRENDGTGRILAASLSCRTNDIAGALMVPFAGNQFEAARKVAPLHSNLDLLATDPTARGTGLASALIDETEKRLAESGVRVWFGCVTNDLDSTQLRPYYQRHGFTVLDDGAPLPPLVGYDKWNLGKDDVTFHFYKRITNQS